jgi:hypothetical protein
VSLQHLCSKLPFAVRFHESDGDQRRDNGETIIAALLTLARSWFAAGRPKAKSPVLGCYEGWSTILGGVLEHAGVAGFLGNLGSLYQFADEEAAH